MGHRFRRGMRPTASEAVRPLLHLRDARLSLTQRLSTTLKFSLRRRELLLRLPHPLTFVF